MKTLIAHCAVDSAACTLPCLAPVVIATSGAVSCGHCGDLMAPAGGHVVFMDITCKGDAVEWFQREWQAVVHLCGQSLVADSIVHELTDLGSLRG